MHNNDRSHDPGERKLRIAIMTNSGVQTFEYGKVLESPFNKISVTIANKKYFLTKITLLGPVE